MASRMGTLFKFNLVAGGACASYFVYSKWAEAQQLKSPICQAALQLLQDYPNMPLILGREVRLKKVISRGAEGRFTNMNPTDGGQARAKCTVEGNKQKGQILVWASRNIADSTNTSPVSPLASQTAAAQEAWAIDKLELHLSDPDLQWVIYESQRSLAAAAAKSAKQQLPQTQMLTPEGIVNY